LDPVGLIAEAVFGCRFTVRSLFSKSNQLTHRILFTAATLVADRKHYYSRHCHAVRFVIQGLA